MGRAKAEMMEAEHRGWYEPDGYVCAECVEDDFLKSVIQAHTSQRQCGYCGKRTRANSAAPVAVLMEHIGLAVSYHFEEPTQAGVPYEKGWLVEPTITYDVLMALPLNCHEKLFEDIAQAFTNTAWVRAAGGHWMSSHPHEDLSVLWGSFVNIIKHEVRFFFHRAPSAKPDHPWEPDPRRILRTIGELVKQIDLIQQFGSGQSLFRVRAREEGANWEIDADQMGAPHRSSRGRAG